MVASCDFDSSANDDGLTTGCPGVDVSMYADFDFAFASASDSADTGPTADHTGDGGKCHNYGSVGVVASDCREKLSKSHLIM